MGYPPASRGSPQPQMGYPLPLGVPPTQMGYPLPLGVPPTHKWVTPYL